MQHVLQAAQGNTIYVILYAARAGPEQGRGVGSRGFFGPLQARNSTRANDDNAGRAKILALDKHRLGRNRPGKLNPRTGTDPAQGLPLRLPPSLCAAVVCVDDWFHGKVDFNQQMFMQFFACPFFYSSFFLSRLRVVVAWGFAGWQELWHYPYLERSIAALGERGSCSCLSLNCPERIIKSGEHWTYPGTLNQTQTYPNIPNRTEPKNP